MLDPVLPHPDADPNRTGDDPTELNLQCGPDGTCKAVPSPHASEQSYSTQIPTGPPAAATPSHHGHKRH